MKYDAHITFNIVVNFKKSCRNAIAEQVPYGKPDYRGHRLVMAREEYLPETSSKLLEKIAK